MFALILPKALILLSAFFLSACTMKQAIKTPVNIIGGLFGYQPPPPQTTLLQELTQAYEICVGAGGGDECVQEAYAIAKQSKNIPEKPLPTGTVIVREVKALTADTSSAGE